MVVISGCQDWGTSAESLDARQEVSGALTTSLLALLGARPELRSDFPRLVTACLESLARGGFSQVPLLSTSVPAASLPLGVLAK